MKIRKAVIPAAGWGTRLLPATKAVPKEMLPVVDRPAIQYVVEEAAAAGVREVLVVTSRGKDDIADHFDRCPDLERLLGKKERHDLLLEVLESARLARFTFVRQSEPKGLGDAILYARDFVGDEPFGVLLPDDLVVAEAGCLQQLADVHSVTGGTVVAVEPVPRNKVSSYGIVRPAGPARQGVIPLAGLVEKPAPSEAPSDLGVVGRYILTPRIFAHLERVQPGQSGEIQLTDALQNLISEEPVHACLFLGTRYDVGNPLGLLKANIALAMERPDLDQELCAYMEEVLQHRQAGLVEAAAHNR